MAIDLNAAKKLLEQKPKSGNSDNEGINFYRLPSSGEAKIRFLPPVEGLPVPGKIVHKHYNLPEIGSLTCLKTWKMDCPICRLLADLEYKVDAKYIESFKSVARSFHHVLVLEGKDDNGNKPDPTTPYILGSGDFTYYWLLDQVTNAEIGDITDPKTGSNVTFKRKRPNGPFDRQISRAATPIADSEDGIQKILSAMVDMEQIWKSPDDAYILKLKTAAKALKMQIDEKINTLAGQPTTETVNAPVPPVEKPTASEKREEIKPTSTPTSTAKPSNAKPCFGKHAEMSGKDASECIVCPDELECEACEG